MKSLLILCNAIDDVTRNERGITTDSPAASRKIFMTAQALRRVGISPVVISLGRGRHTGTTRWFAATARRSANVATLYLAFVDRPLLSYLVSLVAPAIAIRACARRSPRPVLLLYNRSLTYVAAVIVARAYRLPIVLDLEDGYTGTGRRLRERFMRLGTRSFDALCGGRALLACSALASATRLRPTMVYYGVSDVQPRSDTAVSGGVTALLGGTIARDTGADLLADAVLKLRQAAPSWASDLTIEITGKGPSLQRLVALVDAPGEPRVMVWGRISDSEYAALRSRADVGLALKPNRGLLAQTTFPSKVIEMAAAGQLVITTDISDVRKVLGDRGARYVTTDTADALIDELRWVVENRDEAVATAARGRSAVADLCAPGPAASRLAAFLFGEKQ